MIRVLLGSIAAITTLQACSEAEKTSVADAGANAPVAEREKRYEEQGDAWSSLRSGGDETATARDRRAAP